MVNELEKSLRYIKDADVDGVLDEKIRTILSRCFTHEPRFKTQRFYNILPKHRWIIEVNGEVVAHLAAHELELEADGRKPAFIGIAEVCVIPEYRGRRLVSLMLSNAESINPAINYSILLGNPDIYKSSGYNSVSNVYFPDVSDKPCEAVMVKLLKGEPWPEGNVIIKGLHF
jgi:predicted acetyltransferase